MWVWKAKAHGWITKTHGWFTKSIWLSNGIDFAVSLCQGREAFARGMYALDFFKPDAEHLYLSAPTLSNPALNVYKPGTIIKSFTSGCHKAWFINVGYCSGTQLKYIRAGALLFVFRDMDHNRSVMDQIMWSNGLIVRLKHTVGRLVFSARGDSAHLYVHEAVNTKY